MPIRILDLTWTDERIDHVGRHGVDPDEFEDVCFGFHFARRVGDRRFALVGITSGGRFVTVFVDESSTPMTFERVTARDSSRIERRWYLAERGGR